MNIEARQFVREQKSHTSIIDVDILQTYGNRGRQGFAKSFPYPKSQPLASRRDSWPPGGGLPASDLDFMRKQHLDFYGIEYAIMTPLSPTGQGDQNDEFSAAMAFAANEFQLDGWNRRDPRLLASVVVPYEDGEAAAAEIRRRAGDRRFAHVLMRSRTADLMGKKPYWPIYAAAEEAGFPVGVHVFGTSGRPASNSGWPSFYIEDMTEHASCCQAQVTSLIMGGVFERHPGLKIVMIEAGFAWLPALGWRLDKLWKRLRDEVPHLRRAPSEYIREHIWVSTQPMEETEEPEHLLDLMGWVGWDRFMFASDYPHWDFDDPLVALPPALDDVRRTKIYSGTPGRSIGSPEMAGHVVATVDQIPPGQRKLVEVAGRAIVVYNLGGEFFALSNRCPHRGGGLADGIQTGLVESTVPGQYSYSRPGEMVKCPWHGWEFDIRTGKSWCDPSWLRIRQYPVSVQPGTQLVEGPYVAESFPVRLENNYVVVEA